MKVFRVSKLKRLDESYKDNSIGDTFIPLLKLAGALSDFQHFGVILQ